MRSGSDWSLTVREYEAQVFANNRDNSKLSLMRHKLEANVPNILSALPRDIAALAGIHRLEVFS